MTETDQAALTQATPWMLRAAAVARCPSACDFQRQMAARAFGELAWLEVPPADVAERITAVEERLRDREELLATWKRHLAREILVALRLGRTWAERLAKDLADWTVFRDCGWKLSELRGFRLAVAAFPYAEEDRGQVCHLWIFEGRDAGPGPNGDHRGRLQLAPPWREELERRLVFLVEQGAAVPAQGISGDSWQLAWALALRSLAEPAANGAFAALARRWIASGAVDGDGRVSRVGKIAEKLRAGTTREWLLPAKNRGEVPTYDSDGLPVNAWFAASLDSAWAHVTEDGVVDGGETEWPGQVGVMHSFVSGAWMPVVACALLCRPRRVVLWHSDNKAVSADPAKEIKKLFKNYLFKEVEGFAVDLRPISSRSLAEAERELAAALRKDLAGGGDVVFNVTQGNRVMSYAPLELSRLYPNLLLVYRDLDAPFAVFTMIRYEGSRPVTLEVKRPEPLPRGDIEWDPLFSKPPERQPTTVEMMWQMLQKKHTA